MYSFNSIVRYSEVDQNKNITLPSVLAYFQDSSLFHSEEVGLGLQFLSRQQRVWYLSAWQIVIHRLPIFRELINIATAPYDFKGIYGYRNFVMKNIDGDILISANSIWVLMNTQNWHPARILQENVASYQLETPISMDYEPRKIMIPGELQILDAFPVSCTNIDVNHHVNNAQYVVMSQNYLPKDFEVRQLRADYRTSAVLGDTILPMIKITDHSCTVVLASLDKKPYAIIEYTK